MVIDPRDLVTNLDEVERVEKATARLVTQALLNYREQAAEIFALETDISDACEDITREALDALGTSRIPVRLFGKIDYKRARHVFQPEYSLSQALFVDSKAEDLSGAGTITIQTAQTSMGILYERDGVTVHERGTLPTVYEREDETLLTTTIFVKFTYERESGSLKTISIITVPNGVLQERYNPDPAHTIWRAGRHAPSRGEAFRVRLRIASLKELARWRIQAIQIDPPGAFAWEE